MEDSANVSIPIRSMLTPFSRPALPDRRFPPRQADLTVAAAVLATMYAGAPKMAERIARALPLTNQVRFGVPESWGQDRPNGPLKRAFPHHPKPGEHHTVLDPDGCGVVVAGYPQADTFCTCPDFWNSGTHNPTGTCKHQIAMALWITAQAMAVILPHRESAALPPCTNTSIKGEVFLDPLILLMLLLLAAGSSSTSIRLCWTGSAVAVGNESAVRWFPTSAGVGCGTVDLCKTARTELVTALSGDWLAADECVLVFKQGHLRCIAETFEWTYRRSAEPAP